MAWLQAVGIKLIHFLGIYTSRKITDPCQPADYNDDSEILFVPDGTSPLIGGWVERVIGPCNQFQQLKLARKTILINAPRYWDADPRWQISSKQRLIQEARSIHQARHHHVIQLIHIYFDNQHRNTDEIRFAIIMDRADSDLRYYLQYGKCPEKRWFGCLSRVVRYIHSLDIRHQDIKPENILIKGGRVLLADFGLSQNGIRKKKPSHFLWIREYCAPEVDNGDACGLPADIFSLGAVFLEMLIARDCPDLFEDLENILKFPSDGTLSYAKNIVIVHLWIEENLRPLGWQDNDGIRSKCREMLRSDHCQRPSAKDLDIFWLLLSASDECKACKCA